MTHKISTILTCMLLLTGCGSDTNTTEPVPSLENHNWNLVSYGFQSGEIKEVIINTNYSLFFDESSSVIGKIDCNTFTSSYETDNIALNIQLVAPTEIACPLSGDIDYELQNEIIITALSTIQSYSFEGSELIIISIDSTQLTFSITN